jgi:iron complex outermembrane receptor protein
MTTHLHPSRCGVRTAQCYRGLSARLFLVGLALAFLSATALAQTSSTGSIAGRVENGVTGDALNNARVSVKGSSNVVLTDEGGHYVLTNVPPGPVTVRVAYSGMDLQETSVVVTPGQVAQHDFSLRSAARHGNTDTMTLDAFVVQSTRETDAGMIAVNEQRVANNIKSVVSADEFGTIADSNPGELLKWLPGVSVEYFANNITGVDVRGLGSVNTEINFDGMPVASAYTESNSRAFNMQGGSASDIARVEVRKLPLPEDSSNALGGSINLIRRSAFEYSKRRIEYKALFTSDIEELTLSERDGPKDRSRQYWRPNWQMKWTEPVSKNFGFAVTVGHDDKIVRTHWSLPSWDYGSASQAAAAKTALAAGQKLTTRSIYNPVDTNYLLHDAPKEDAHDYASLRLDWRPVRDLTLAYSLGYTLYTNQTADDIRYRWRTAQTGSGEPSTYNDEFTVLGRKGGGGVYYDTPLWRDQNNPTLTNSFEARWRHGPWTVSAKGTYSVSKHTFKDTEDGFFNSTSASGIPQTGIGASTANPIPITVNFYDHTYYAPQRIEVLDANGKPIEWWKAENIRIGGARSKPGKAKEIVGATKLFVKRDFNTVNPFSIQLGLDLAEQYRFRRYDQNIWRFVGADGVPNSADDTASQIAAVALPPHRDTFANTPPIERISLSRLYKLYQDHPTWFQYLPNESYRNTVNQPYELTEKSFAPYVEFFSSVLDNRLHFAGGIRYERSDADARGFLQSQSDAYQKNADGSVKRDSGGKPLFLPGVTAGSLEEARLTMHELGATGHGRIDNFFPSLHVSYDVTPNLQFQIGFAKTQAKNRFDRTVIPETTIKENSSTSNGLGTIEINNADLQPWVGYNYEARLSYYTSSGGVFGVGAFRKNIHNYQVGDDIDLDSAEAAAAWGFGPEYVGYEISTLKNEGNARIDGVELEARQNLDRFFPHWLHGFDVNASFSYTNLVGRPGGGDFGNLRDQNHSVFVTYRHNRLTARVGYRLVGQFTNNDPDTAAGIVGIRHTLAQHMVDASLEYRATRWATLFVSGNNLGDESRRRERQFAEAPVWSNLNSSNNLGMTVTAGITGTF